MIKKIIEYMLNQLLRIDAFQNWVNYKCNVKCGLDFVASPYNSTIDQVLNEYNFIDIQKEDIVLDIGANVGAFSVFMAKQGVRHVYAVEPITIMTLGENISKSHLQNVSQIGYPLGTSQEEIVTWETELPRRLQTKTLTELIQMCGGHIDFFKCDCEGAEWNIRAEELKGIRRIEMEVHNMDGKHNILDYLKIFDDAKFQYTYNIHNETCMLVHARLAR